MFNNLNDNYFLKFRIITIFEGVFNAYLRIAIRFYETFPKRFDPFGFLVVGYFLGISVISGYKISCIMGFFIDKHNNAVFS